MPHLLTEVVAALVHALTAASAGAWVLGYRNARKSVEALKQPRPCRDPPTTTVIIPARNAADTIEKVINSLRAQDMWGNGADAVIVDDGSTDDTPEIVRRLAGPGLTYVRVETAPPEWAPKNWACWVGARRASGDVLVFLDADTWFLRPDSLRALACAANEYRVASFAPRFRCPTMRCRAVETALTTFSHAFLGFDKVADPRKGLAWFYGCCWGITKTLYNEIGGHSAVRPEIVEDKAMARILKRRGIVPAVVKGFDHVETLWYGSVSETASTLGRVLHTYGSKAGKALAASAAVTIAYLSPIMEVLTYPLAGPASIALAGIAYASQVAAHVIGADLNRYRRWYTLTAPIFGPVLSAGLVKAVNYSRKGITWKGRRLRLTS